MQRLMASNTETYGIKYRDICGPVLLARCTNRDLEYEKMLRHHALTRIKRAKGWRIQIHILQLRLMVS